RICFAPGEGAALGGEGAAEAGADGAAGSSPFKTTHGAITPVQTTAIASRFIRLSPIWVEPIRRPFIVTEARWGGDIFASRNARTQRDSPRIVFLILSRTGSPVATREVSQQCSGTRTGGG